MKKYVAYLDNASTTPLNPAVLAAMLPYFKKKYGNPSNLYELGRQAKQAAFDATQKIATALHCMPGEIVYTGSATEADNLALAGIARTAKANGMRGGNRIIISSLEHKGILSVCAALEKEGFEIIKIRANKDGLIDLDHFKECLTDNTILVSVSMADSETGTIQPIKEISRIIRNHQALKTEATGEVVSGSSAVGQRRAGHNFSDRPLLHTDASQAAAYSEINVDKLGVDLMTLSAHKLSGPKGIGALYVRKGTEISPIIFGGGQQGKLRSGTENVPGIVGFGAALEITRNHLKSEAPRVKKLRDMLESGIRRTIPKVVLNGHKTKRLPNFLNISILDVEGEALLLHLDEQGIVVNTGSACNSESLEPSYVLTALGNPYEFIHGSIRFTLGTTTTSKDIDHVLKHLPSIVSKLRKISPLNLDAGQKKSVSDPRPFIGRQTPHFLKKQK